MELSVGIIDNEACEDHRQFGEHLERPEIRQTLIENGLYSRLRKIEWFILVTPELLEGCGIDKEYIKYIFELLGEAAVAHVSALAEIPFQLKRTEN